jgi:2-aminoadipate transaminase
MEYNSAQISYSRLGQRAVASETVITRLMGEALADPEVLSLAAGFTDNALLPLEAVQAAVTRLKGRTGREALQYGLNAGRPGLREAALELLRSYPRETLPGLGMEDVLITNGSQQGLYLLIQALCDPGDIVLVEDPTYFVFLELLRGLGVQALPMPVAVDGSIDCAAMADELGRLKAAGQHSRVKAVYLMGTFANPSTRSMAETTKRQLAALLERCHPQAVIIEDMAYRELYFEEPAPALSLLSMPEYEDLPVVYAGTFTKPFATGLKVGFLATRQARLRQTLSRIKGHQDFGTAHFTQAIVEEAWRSGEYLTHLRHVRPLYHAKCHLLEQSLRENGLDTFGWSWEPPRGGLLLWAKGPAGTDTRIASAFHRQALRRKVLYVPGDLCFAKGQPHHYVRLSFGALPADLIPEAARRFCEAARHDR